jgi:alanyl-tRNA synthetase
VGDLGLFIVNGATVAEVMDTQKPVGKVFFHHVKAVEKLTVGEKVTAEVSGLRYRTACNHTAVHVINAALKQVFGDTTRQAGSIVTPEKFRFDYTSTKAPTKEDMARVEAIANAAIRENYSVFKMERPLKDAEKFGATTLLGEKYADPARFVLINKGGWEGAKDRYSLELCGGTHIDALGELMLVKVLKDSSVSRGVRRIEGVAGLAAVDYLRTNAEVAEAAAKKLSVPVEELSARLDQLLDNLKELKSGKAKAAPAADPGQGKKLLAGGIDGSGSSLVVYDAGSLDMRGLRGFSDEVKKGLKSTLLFIYSRAEGKFSFIVTHTGDVGADSSAIAKAVSAAINGSGGGRKDFAQGGGEIPADMAGFETQLVVLVKKHA